MALLCNGPALAQTTELVQNQAELPDLLIVDRLEKNAPPPQSSSSSFAIRQVELTITKPDDLKQVAARVPGIAVYGSTPRNLGINIRGYGSNQFNDGVDSGVGLYLDGIYLERQLYGAMSAYDLQSLTVFRGPQGASYGLGSTGGELHIQTNPPSFQPSSDTSISLGSNQYLRLETSKTGALDEDKMAGRISLYHQQREGYITNVFDGNKVNDQNNYAIRGQLLILPDAQTQLRLSAEYGISDQQCCAVALLAPVSPSIQASDEYMGYQRPGTNPYDRVVDNDFGFSNRLERYSLAAVWDRRLSDRYRITSLTGFNALNYSPNRVEDSSSLRLVNGSIVSDSWQFTHEARLHAYFKRLDATLGLFYMHQKLRGKETGVLGDQIARWALGGVLRQQVPALDQNNSGFIIDALIPPEAVAGTTLLTPYDQRSNTLSAFASGDWRLAEDTTLITGLRLTASERRAHISRSRTGGNLGSSPLAFTNALNTFGALTGQDVRDVTYDGLVDSLVGANFDRRDARRDKGVSGKLALERKLNDERLIYASLARGFKSGGLNLAGLTRQVKPQFEPETFDNLQAGFKQGSLASKLSYSLTVYQSRVKNMQALTHDEGDGLIRNPRPNNVINIPKVTLRGVEADIYSAPNNNLRLGAGLAWNMAISDDFTNAPNQDTGQNDKDLSGKQLYNAPRFGAFTSIGLRLPYGGKGEFYGLFETHYRSGTFGAVDQSRSSFIDGYALSNLRLGWVNYAGNWDLQLWINNLFNKDYLEAISGLYSVGDYGGYAGPPRAYGVTLSLSTDK